MQYYNQLQSGSKKMHKFLFIFAGLFIYSTVFGQTISLAEFLNQVKQNHPFFKKETRTVEIEENIFFFLTND